MSATAIGVRLQWLIDERATVSNLHDDLLSTIESREPGERDMSDVEQSTAEGYRARSQELDTEIAALTEHFARDRDSQEASRVARGHLAGRGESYDVNGGEIVYRTFAAFARDSILARRQGGVFDQIHGRAGGREAVEQARERLARTPANTISSDVGGLTPAQHIAQIFQVIETSRPIVASAMRADLERGRLTYPVVVSTPVVALQSAEKTEAGNTKLQIDMEETTAATYLGGGDLSWQAINWSTPSALDLWFRFCAAHYALLTEQDAAQALQHSAFSNNIASTLGALTDFSDILAAIAAGAGDVYANSARVADTVYMAPNALYALAAVASTESASFTGVGSLSLSGQGGSLMGLNVVVSRGMDSGVIVVGDSSGLLVAETAGAPVELRAVEPAIGGLEVGLIGAFEAVVVDDGAFAMITTAS
jgi:hypothetical protein